MPTPRLDGQAGDLDRENVVPTRGGRAQAEAAAALAHPSLVGLLRLAIAEHTTEHRLLSLLTELTGDEPADALERLPTVIGLAYDHFGDDHLPEVLARLAAKSGLSTSTRADATFELALADLHTALSQDEQDASRSHLERALMRLRIVMRDDEARHDACAYAAAVDAVLTFAALDTEENTDTFRARLAAATDQLEASTAVLHAWNSGFHDLPG
ncbi:hypothetical protein ACFQV2_12765 [Actinokineospora soli]|uniref:Uncharacterized protein n=1 Tax=Actinokineospora soli TaxID=1048753 RepID=A0ABW2TMU1_9PSEU